jgi:phytol kinase
MIERLLPDLRTVLLVVPVALLLTMTAATCVGWLRVERGVRAPYTRKLFHFIVISAALAVQLEFGSAGTVVYGAVVACAVLFAVWRGSGFAFHEALARPTDAPHARLFILVPLATTAIGGVLTNVLFPAWAHVGYLVVAWGDAVGEPVGTRWGKHAYRVPSFAGVRATRTLEGSTAVLLASTAAAFLALTVTGETLASAIPAAVAIGSAVTMVEAFSHHGLDNLTVQLAATGIAAALL